MSGLVRFHELHGVGARFGFSHHAKFFSAAENGLDAIAHDLVIIHEEDVKGHIEIKYCTLFAKTCAGVKRRRRELLAEFANRGPWRRSKVSVTSR